MRKPLLLVLALMLATGAVAGFKVKLIKAKKPDQFQKRVAIGDVIWAADLLTDGGDQKDFFYKELTPSNVVAVRLALFNRSGSSLVIPAAAIELRDPAGKSLSQAEPVAVADAVLAGKVVTAGTAEEAPLATVRPVMRDPRYDPNDPLLDPVWELLVEPTEEKAMGGPGGVCQSVEGCICPSIENWSFDRGRLYAFTTRGDPALRNAASSGFSGARVMTGTGPDPPRCSLSPPCQRSSFLK